LLSEAKEVANEAETKEALVHLTQFHKNNTLKTATFSFIGSCLVSRTEKE